MTQSLKDFFAAWGLADTGAARKLVDGAVGKTFYYADPHAPDPFDTVDDFMVFLANFPKGAKADVIEPPDVHHGHTRANVSFDFGGGKAMVGQYFADLDADAKITRILGFPGKGAE